MRWEERLLQELDDLELQAEGLHLAERDALVAELAVAEYAEVDLASRLHASTGSEVRLWLVDGSTVTGVVRRAGRDWLLVVHGGTATAVRTAAIMRATGLSPRATPSEARSALAGLGLASVLRGLAEEHADVTIGLLDGTAVAGEVARVGRDFVELTCGARVEVVPFAGLAAVRQAG